MFSRILLLATERYVVCCVWQHMPNLFGNAIVQARVMSNEQTAPAYVKGQEKLEHAFGKALQGVTFSSPVFTVKMTDNPASYKGLLIEIESIAVFSLDQGWQELEILTHRFDVLQLTNGREIELAKRRNLNPEKIEVYTHLRIKFGLNNALLIEDSLKIKRNHMITKSQVNLQFIQSATVDIELDTPVVFASSTSLLLDFDVARSVKWVGSHCILQPVITQVCDPNTGFFGVVPGCSRAIIYATNFNETYSTYTNITGAFMMRGIEPSHYMLLTRSVKSKSTMLHNKQSWFAEIDIAEGELTEVKFLNE